MSNFLVRNCTAPRILEVNERNNEKIFQNQLTKREDRKMKKIIILSVVFTFILAGVLYATYEQPNEVEPVTAEQVYMGQISYEMPDVIPDPMVGFPLY
jgi:Trk-type K+ transport system membrane component